MKQPQLTQIRYLDGLRYQRALLAGCEEVISHEKEINRINVFPIPDRDTGSNLKKTFSPLIEKYPLGETSINIISQDMADLAIASVLGYSGIIFAQFLSGLAEGMNEYERVSVEDFAGTLNLAVTRAYEALENPVEGTVLTVFKAWSDEVQSLSSETDDFVPLLKKSLERAVSALDETPQQLEVLRENKVVDAGGKAFVYFLKGIISYTDKGELLPVSPQKKQGLLKRQPFAEVEKVQFCAEFCVQKENLDRKSLVEELNLLGRDLIFYGSQNFAKAHISTNDPEEIFSCAGKFGGVSSKRIFKFDPNLLSQEKDAIVLISDTTCDISDEYIQNNDVYFVPIKVQAMDKVYTDKLNIIPEEFYQMMTTSRTLPKTSQPSLMDFSKIYEHFLVHYRSIISVQLSSTLSGTFQTAVQAANNIDPDRITVLDSKTTSVGLGLIMREGMKAVNEGLDFKATIDRLEKAIQGSDIFVGIPTLKYLVKGGRVKKAKGFVASVLNINPILCIDREGALVPIGKTRGKKKLENKVLDIAFGKIRKKEMIQAEPILDEMTKKEEDVSVAVVHANAPELGKRLARRIEQELGQEVAMVMNASPVLGAHAGPGAIAVAILCIRT